MGTDTDRRSQWGAEGRVAWAMENDALKNFMNLKWKKNGQIPLNA